MTTDQECPVDVHGFECCPKHECCTCEEPTGGRSTWAGYDPEPDHAIVDHTACQCGDGFCHGCEATR